MPCCPLLEALGTAVQRPEEILTQCVIPFLPFGDLARSSPPPVTTDNGAGAEGALTFALPSSLKPRAHCCWAQPGQALESFEKCLDGGSPRSWPGLPLGGAVSQGTGGEAGILSSETWMEEAGVRAGLPHGKNKQAQFTHCWQGGRCWL